MNLLGYHFIYLPSPLPLAECDTRSIFLWSTVGLNLEFFFFYTSYLTKTKKPVYPTINSLMEREGMDSCLS